MFSNSIVCPQVYYEPLKRPQAAALVDSSLVGEIFYQIPEICSIHERFLQQLTVRVRHWDPEKKIGDVFVNTVCRDVVVIVVVLAFLGTMVCDLVFSHSPVLQVSADGHLQQVYRELHESQSKHRDGQTSQVHVCKVS